MTKLSTWEPWKLEQTPVDDGHGGALARAIVCGTDDDPLGKAAPQGQLVKSRLVVGSLTPPSGDCLVRMTPGWTGEWEGDVCNSASRKLWISPGTGKWIDHDFKFMRVPVKWADLRAATFRVMDDDRETVRSPTPSNVNEGIVQSLLAMVGGKQAVFERPRRFFLVTPEPGLVASVWQPKSTSNEAAEYHRHNCILTLPCDSAAAAERMLAEAVPLRGLFGDVVLLATAAFEGKIIQDVHQIILTTASASMSAAATGAGVEVLFADERR